MTSISAWAMTGLLCDPIVMDSVAGIVCFIDTWAKGHALTAFSSFRIVAANYQRLLKLGMMSKHCIELRKKLKKGNF